MIVTLDNVKIYLGLDEGDDSENHVIQPIHNSVEQAVKEYIDWEPEETAHVNKLYDGTGDKWLMLDELYVSAMTRVATVRENAIKVKNTSTDATNAYATVSATGVTVVVDGGTNDDSSTLTFSSYATLTTLVAAIVAVGKGWEAEIYDSDYNGYKSANLLQAYVQFVGSWNGVTASWSYLDMAGEPIQDVRLYADRGAIYYGSGFPSGHRNIAVSYTSGWAAASMPASFQDAVKLGVRYQYEKRNAETVGVSAYTVGSVRVQFSDPDAYLPPEAIAILDNSKYKKVTI